MDIPNSASKSQATLTWHGKTDNHRLTDVTEGVESKLGLPSGRVVDYVLEPIDRLKLNKTNNPNNGKASLSIWKKLHW